MKVFLSTLLLLACICPVQANTYEACYGKRNNPEEALQCIQETIPITSSDSSLYKLYFLQAYLQGNLGHYDKATISYHQALKINDWSVEDNVNCLINIAYQFSNLSQYEIAATYIKKALEVEQQKENQINLKRRLANLYRKSGIMDSAIWLNYEVMQYFQQQKDYKQLSRVYNRHGIMLMVAGRHDEAIGYFQNILDNAELTGRPNYWRFIASFNYGEALMKVGKTDRAYTYISNGLTSYKNTEKELPEAYGEALHLLYKCDTTNVGSEHLLVNYFHHHFNADAIKDAKYRLAAREAHLISLQYQDNRYRGEIFINYADAMDELLRKKENALLAHQKMVTDGIFAKITTMAEQEKQRKVVLYVKIGLAALLLVALVLFVLHRRTKNGISKVLSNLKLMEKDLKR